MGKNMLGVFETTKEAIEAAVVAQKELVTNYSYEDRDRFIARIKQAVIDSLEEFCRLEFEETGYGRVDDKKAKNGGIVSLPGTEVLPSAVHMGVKGVTIEYPAPYGVIGAVTPVTNPSSTILCNGVMAMTAGNSVVFNAHPGAKDISAKSIHLFNEAVVAEGGPCNIVTMPRIPSLDTLDDIMGHPAIKLLVGTGGPGMVSTLMKSGKKVIAAGAGNPPCIVDETADVDKAAVGIFYAASYDNGLLCATEKVLYVVDEVFEEFFKNIVTAGARVLTREEADKVTAIALQKLPTGKTVANKNYVGKDAAVILKAANVPVSGDPRLAIFEAKQDDSFVLTEQMMPILPIVRCKDFGQAKAWAVQAEQGLMHSASIWSNIVERVTSFGREINTTIFVHNGSTMAVFGVDGTGKAGPTIATPTGEGICTAATFTRKRHFAMANGGNFIL